MIFVIFLTFVSGLFLTYYYCLSRVISLARFLAMMGILLILLPIPVYGLEVLSANMQHLTTWEQRKWIGIGAFFCGFFSIPLGLLSMVIGFVLYTFRSKENPDVDGAASK